ncbi:MAG: hypothetical protein FJ276_02860 [Planctomycetes bacterium]|nr:hypothetical protein [Planctomycetota bacterium]
MGKEKWHDLLCPKCQQLKKTCNCTSEPSTPSKSSVVRVGRETKGRRGKGVTIISELQLDQDRLTELAATLKTRLGTGGTVKERRIAVSSCLDWETLLWLSYWCARIWTVHAGRT